MNELQKKGGQPSKPVRYGILWDSYFYDGIVTQRNPLRANISHIEAEYYGNRSVTLLDGINCEVSSKLTLIRRPGNSVYNFGTFPPINRFYENRTSSFNPAQTVLSEKIQVIADTASVVYDATGPSTKNALFTKTASAGSTYFQSVGNTLYFSDGPDQKKYTTPKYVWSDSTSFSPGSLIAITGNLQMALGGITLPIIATASNGSGLFTIWVDPSSIPNQFPNLENVKITFSGLTAGSSLNGHSLPANIISTTLGIFSVSTTPALAYGKTADTGTGSTGTGDTGGSSPAWSSTPYGITQDGQQQWKCYGPVTENWGVKPPTSPLTLTPVNNTRWWRPDITLVSKYSVYDSNGNVQIALGLIGTAVSFITGLSYPSWAAPVVNNLNPVTNDGTIQWICLGKPGTWGPGQSYGSLALLLDSNGNLQANLGSSGTSGGSEPTWNTTIYGTTADNTVTWTNIGPGTILTTQSIQYSFSLHAVDGSVSTSAPTALIQGPVVGPPQNPSPEIVVSYIQMDGVFTPDSQLDQIWIWRTVQGGSTLFLEDQISMDGPFSTGNFSYEELGILDTQLDELIEAPIANSSDPPPVGLGILAFHLGCIFGAVGPIVYYSDGPQVTSGNGNTAWNPNNFFEFPSTVYRLFPTSNGLLVFTSSNVYIIQGTNTANSPLFSVPFLPSYLGLLSYDAFSSNGSIIYMYTTDNQIVTLDPSSGVSEVGAAIGDQFGPGYGTGTFNPTSAHVTWHIAGSQDKGLYVSDFQGVWWRLCPTPAPETGLTWSPKAQIVGGFSAVQSVEVVPGTHQLLLGPQSNGMILKRDYSVFTDSGSSYNAYAVLGSMVLAQPGQLAGVESFTTDSVAIGTPISLAVQLDEIAPFSGINSITINDPGAGYFVGDIVEVSYPGGSGGLALVTAITGIVGGPVAALSLLKPGAAYPATGTGLATTGGTGSGLTVNVTSLNYFETLNLYVPDPTQLSPSNSIYGQRFYLSQTQQPAACRHLQVQVNWGTDTVMNELLSMSVFGCFEQEK